MIDPVIQHSVCLGLALLFASAAWHKLSDLVHFELTLRAYRLLPSWLNSPIATLFPLAETSIAVGFLYPPARKGAAFAAVVLLVHYTGAIAANLVRGRREIDCGCFASSARVPLSGLLVGRNMFLIVAASVPLMSVQGRTLVWLDVLTVLTTLVTLSLLWAAGQRLSQTGPALRRLGASQ